MNKIISNSLCKLSTLHNIKSIKIIPIKLKGKSNFKSKVLYWLSGQNRSNKIIECYNVNKQNIF